MRYMSIFTKANNPSIELVIDLHKPNRAHVSHAIWWLSYSVDHAYQSNYKSLLKAKFPRTVDSPNVNKSRVIKAEFAPKRLSSAEAIYILENLNRRGKDKAKRTVHPNSLCNLRPAAKFTAQNRPNKPCLLSDQQVQKAEELKGNGCSWRTIGDSLGVNSETVRSTLRRRASQASNQGLISS